MDSKLYEAVTTRDNIDVLKEMEKSLQVGDQLTPTNSTVLHLACQYGSKKCVREILSVHESLLLKINCRGETALHLAASQGHYDVVGALIDAAKSSRLQPNNLTHTSLTVVQILIRTTSLELETALHVAVRYKRRDLVQLLVKEDPSHSYPKNKYKETPLYLASFMGEFDIIDTILQNCTSPTFGGPDGRTALHAAAMNTDDGSDCMRLLLKKMKDLIKVADNRGWTAYHYVAYNDICEIVEDLVRVDKSVGYLAEKEYERTPLHIAAHEGNELVLMELVKYYPDCWEVVDVNGKNILHLAVEQHVTRPISSFILSQGFEAGNNMLYQRDNEGNTPLHLMAKLECYVPQLMDPERIDFKKVNWDMLNDKNVTPLDILEDKYMTHVFDIVPDRALVRRTQENVLVCGKNLNLWSILERKNYDKELAQLKKIRQLNLYADQEEKVEKREEKEKEEHRNMINTHMIVAALITTVALTAGFAMPGGFDQNNGSAVLIRKPAFKTFIAADSVALLFSITSLFLYFIATCYHDVDRVTALIVWAGLLNVSSIIAMMVAFITGTYVVLAPSSGIAITVCVIASSFFLFVFYYFARIYMRLNLVF